MSEIIVKPSRPSPKIMKVTDAAINPSDEACCTCAKLLSSVPRYSAATEKPLPDDRRLECCARVICGNCIYVRPPDNDPASRVRLW